MILVDTSIWADHFRAADPGLVPLIDGKRVAIHRLVIEELAMGHLPRREITLAMLGALPDVPMAERPQLISFVETEGFVGSGLSLVDAHLLMSAIEGGLLVWTRDKRLAAQAERLGCAWTAD